VLEVRLPDDFDVTPFAIVELGHPSWEWIVPAEVLNDQAAVRLMTQEELDSLRGGPSGLPWLRLIVRGKVTLYG
jgi:hypothetical protein